VSCNIKGEQFLLKEREKVNREEIKLCKREVSPPPHTLVPYVDIFQGFSLNSSLIFYIISRIFWNKTKFPNYFADFINFE
jgi:hypothetical protein